MAANEGHSGKPFTSTREAGNRWRDFERQRLIYALTGSPIFYAPHVAQHRFQNPVPAVYRPQQHYNFTGNYRRPYDGRRMSYSEYYAQRSRNYDSHAEKGRTVNRTEGSNVGPCASSTESAKVVSEERRGQIDSEELIVLDDEVLGRSPAKTSTTIYNYDSHAEKGRTVNRTKRSNVGPCTISTESDKVVSEERRGQINSEELIVLDDEVLGHRSPAKTSTTIYNYDSHAEKGRTVNRTKGSNVGPCTISTENDKVVSEERRGQIDSEELLVLEDEVPGRRNRRRRKPPPAPRSPGEKPPGPDRRGNSEIHHHYHLRRRRFTGDSNIQPGPDRRGNSEIHHHHHLRRRRSTGDSNIQPGPDRRRNSEIRHHHHLRRRRFTGDSNIQLNRDRERFLEEYGLSTDFIIRELPTDELLELLI